MAPGEVLPVVLLLLEPPTLSDLVIDRSAVGTRLSTSVAVLLAPFGSVVPAAAVTVAVLLSVPDADPLTLAITV